MSWSLPSSTSAPLPAADLDKALADRATQWATHVADLPESLWFGCKRLLLATSVRADPVDGLVDAVICWENMFGAGTGVRVTVATAIARLLEPSDETRRQILFDEIGSLYVKRNQIVHGHKEPSPQMAGRDRNEAVRIAVKALEALLSRHDLLSIDNPAKRAERLLVGS